VWIGIRPERHAPLVAADTVAAEAGRGLAGDHYKTRTNGARQLTLIQAEHLDAIASYLDRDAVTPEMLRRNIVVKGINLLALKNKRFQLGSVLCEYTGECHPCSRMEAILGQGGYNAVRGHGGITARIISSGSIALGDVVRVVEAEASNSENHMGK
ncbi:MAG: MOSC domain-containing protein, partial [Burkholderiaceae bacterium]